LEPFAHRRRPLWSSREGPFFNDDACHRLSNQSTAQTYLRTVLANFVDNAATTLTPRSVIDAVSQ
jgi:hypothetical protein